MKPEDVPMGDRILPHDVCDHCGETLEVLEETGDEADTVYISCPAKQDEKDEHTEYSGQPRATLQAGGWKI